MPEYYSTRRLHQLSSTSIFVKLSLCARFIFGKTIESFEFFRLEFYRLYRICRKLFLVVLKMEITKNSLLQIL